MNVSTLVFVFICLKLSASVNFESHNERTTKNHCSEDDTCLKEGSRLTDSSQKPKYNENALKYKSDEDKIQFVNVTTNSDESKLLELVNKVQINDLEDKNNTNNINTEKLGILDYENNLDLDVDESMSSHNETEFLNDTLGATSAFDNQENSDQKPTETTTTTATSSTTTTTETTTAMSSTTTTTKSTTTTTTAKSSTSPTLQNAFPKTDDVCFCDLKIGECDVNCCCDDDCSYLHRLTFLKCVDLKPHYNSNHCYRTMYIYRNNTKLKMTKSERGLFCIVKDNSPFQLNYKPKAVITNLKDFEKALHRKKFYMFSPADKLDKKTFYQVPYRAESKIWTIQNGKLMYFDVPSYGIDLKCTSRKEIRYLVDYSTECSNLAPRNKNDCEKTEGLNMFHFLRNLKVIRSPLYVNKTDLQDPEKICRNKTCASIEAFICTSSDLSTCTQTKRLPSVFVNNTCINIPTKVHYFFFHNGTEGINQTKAYFWLRNVTSGSDYVLQKISVTFRWVNTSERVFSRSGNPGYVVGKPVMAGRKIYNSTVRKEAIELSTNPNDWLSVFGISNGICASEKRIPVLFREDAEYSCRLPLGRDFEKGKCLHLQNLIFSLLVGEDFANVTSDYFFNKFAASFGNSEVEETGDWVQILADLFPIISSQVTFQTNPDGFVCKNIITSMMIQILYSNVGSFDDPQAKILGVSFRFGKPDDLSFRCAAPPCGVAFCRIVTSISFVDLTEPAEKKFAEPPGLDLKLPHDFFYPFFSKSTSFRLSFALQFVTCALIADSMI